MPRASSRPAASGLPVRSTNRCSRAGARRRALAIQSEAIALYRRTERSMPQSTATAATAAPAHESTIATEAEAAAVLIEVRRLMTELCDIVEEETALVRAGRLTAAAKVAERK